MHDSKHNPSTIMSKPLEEYSGMLHNVVGVEIFKHGLFPNTFLPTDNAPHERLRTYTLQ